MKMIVRVKKIDHDGYNGRDHHPTDDMVGMSALILKVEREDYELDRNADGIDYAYYVFTCRLPDGREVEFIGHELEPVVGLPDSISIVCEE